MLIKTPFFGMYRAYFEIIKLEKLVNGKLNDCFLGVKGESPYSMYPVNPDPGSRGPCGIVVVDTVGTIVCLPGCW